MLLYFTDAVNGASVAVNPEYVVVVFSATEGEHEGKTIINLSGGSLVTSDSLLDVVGRINGELK